MSRVAALREATNDIYVPSGNMGIPRRNMPQIEDHHQAAYFAYLKKNGIKIKEETIKAASLKPIQKEIRYDVVKSLAKLDPKKLEKPLVVTSDGYLMDGHHRWLAFLNVDKNSSVRVIRVSAKMKELLAITRKFEQVIYKDSDNVTYPDVDTTLPF